MAARPPARNRRAVLNSETGSMKTLLIVLGIIGALAIGSAMLGISRDDQTVGVPEAANTGKSLPR
jgi:hypothetical protein